MDETETNEEVELMDGTVTSSGVFKQIFNCGRHDFPSKLSERIVKIEVCLYCVLCVLIGLCAIYLKKYIGNGEAWAIVLTAIVVFVTVLVIMSMTTQPKSRKELTFKVIQLSQFVPFWRSFSLIEGTLGASDSRIEHPDQRLLDADAGPVHLDSFRRLDGNR